MSVSKKKGTHESCYRRRHGKDSCTYQLTIGVIVALSIEKLVSMDESGLFPGQLLGGNAIK